MAYKRSAGEIFRKAIKVADVLSQDIFKTGNFIYRILDVFRSENKNIIVLTQKICYTDNTQNQYSRFFMEIRHKKKR